MEEKEEIEEKKVRQLLPSEAGKAQLTGVDEQEVRGHRCTINLVSFFFPEKV